MLKIPNSLQIRAWDRFTIQETPILSIDLMERACAAFVDWFVGRFSAHEPVGILCGPGNNGGDGLGIARLLKQRGYAVKVWVVHGGRTISEDHTTNRIRVPKSLVIEELDDSLGDNSPFQGISILIDALFGSGLQESVKGIFEQVIQHFNAAKAVRIAVDIPSGLCMEKHSSGAIVRADQTVSFQVPKLAFLVPENAPYVGRWTTVDIGLADPYIASLETPYALLTQKGVSRLLPAREKFSHKGLFGKALLIAGSHGKMGACILSAKAALRSGLGLLTAHVPACGYTALQTAVPEAMVSADVDEFCFGTCPPVQDYAALAVGPGLGVATITAKAFGDLLDQTQYPIVLDADALNLMANDRALLHLIPAGSLLTPHLGELARLIGAWDDDFDRMEKTQLFAQQIHSVVIVKGAHTGIFTPNGKVYFNNTGNPGMATGGSGDVLTGILLGLLSQGIGSVEAACLGVYAHGLAGDLAAEENGYMGMIASDIVEAIPHAFRSLQEAD